MNLLFIDANIYLRFYDSSQPEYKRLLKTLVEVKGNVFITEQLVNEVNRNKLSVFEASCSEPITDDSPKRNHLPEHFDVGGRNVIESWNKKRDDLNITAQDLKRQQNRINHDLLSSISNSTDSVSKELAAIFSMSQPHSANQLERAINRRQIGNPPGKPLDPLGDQLSWEQLLDNISKDTNIWIVSNDSDYFSSYKNSCYLNPVLMMDIQHRTKTDVIVKCFNRLADGLKDFNDNLPLKLATLPEAEELQQISKLENYPSLSGFASGNQGTVPTYSGIQNLLSPLLAIQCPSCHSSDHIIGPIISFIRTHLPQHIYMCQSCGTQFEI